MAGSSSTRVSSKLRAPDDAAEDNDSQATAQSLTAGTPASARLCGTDDDWYAIDIAGNDCALVASLALVADAEGVVNALSDLDLLLVDEAGQVVGAGVGSGAREGINVQVRAGRHALRVRGSANEDVAYVVSADVVCVSFGRQQRDLGVRRRRQRWRHGCAHDRDPPLVGGLGL
jgi:hypothetical protein